jgi:hypothetical protein
VVVEREREREEGLESIVTSSLISYKWMDSGTDYDDFCGAFSVELPDITREN